MLILLNMADYFAPQINKRRLMTPMTLMTIMTFNDPNDDNDL